MLCCEGACSRGRQEFLRREAGLRAIGYSPYNLRSAESASLTPTRHYFVRLVQTGDTNYLMWACSRCGSERVYGAEEA